VLSLGALLVWLVQPFGAMEMPVSLMLLGLMLTVARPETPERPSGWIGFAVLTTLFALAAAGVSAMSIADRWAVMHGGERLHMASLLAVSIGWLVWIGLFGIGVPFAAAFIGMRGLARLRAHRCRTCDYDLGGLTADICPECGEDITDQRNPPPT